MQRKLFLHIGSHRAATTSIQQFMRQDSGPLRKQGIFYPLRGPRHIRLMSEIFSGCDQAGNVAISLGRRADNQPEDIHALVLDVFEKQQMPEGPVVTFCNSIGLSDLTGFLLPPHVTVSMSAEMVEFVRHMPLDSLEPPERDLLRRALGTDRPRHPGPCRQAERTVAAPGSPGGDPCRIYRRRRRNLQAVFRPGGTVPGPAARRRCAARQAGDPARQRGAMQHFVAPLLQQLVASGTISAANKAAPQQDRI